MDVVSKLIDLDRSRKVRLAIVGDPMIDVWHHGRVETCQDGCSKFVKETEVVTAGGAANAVASLSHWNARVELFGPDSGLPVKIRKVDKTGRIVWREDVEKPDYGLLELNLVDLRSSVLSAIRCIRFDVVLISDYDKGFLDKQTIGEIISECNEQGIPVVADAKREPWIFEGAILKVNEQWLHKRKGMAHGFPLVTRGAFAPAKIGSNWQVEELSPVACINHVGAGDCFAAHLVFALAHGFTLVDAATVAHSAGRVYVQHSHNRAPWPHEIQKDLTGSKLFTGFASDLRESLKGKRAVFTNGVWRLFHAGHSWLLDWAKKQGDVLVVGVNDDISAAVLRPGEFCLPLMERVKMLESMSAVDWVIPFHGRTPEGLMIDLKPDILVKGSEYDGQRVPGYSLAKEVRFAPESPFPSHAKDLVKAVRGE
jgi:rfaE bifunctional protein nucleotidyltransferase chain/domain